MHRVAVESTTISTVGHNADTSVLEISFRNGSGYRYFLVPASVYEALRRASSKGVFFNSFIRGRYAFTKL